MLSYKPANATKSPCAKLELKSIKSAKIASDNSEAVSKFYLIIFIVKPSDGEFEVTIKYENATYSLAGPISRLNMYAGQSDCIEDDRLKKYCYCKKKR